MTGYTAVSALGRIVAGEVDTIWTPRTVRPGTPGLILLHGQGNPKAYMDGSAQRASMRLAGALAGAGIPTIAGEMHGNAWANDTGMTDITNAWNILKAQFPTIRTDKVYLLGASMGAAMMTRYVQLNPGSVAAAVGMIPAYDPRAIYVANNVGDVAMEAAWGFSGLGNFPAALNLPTHVASAVGVPLLTSYASNDTVVPAASVVTYHNAAGGLPENLIDVGALEHTDAAIAALPISTIGRFLVANSPS